MDLIERIFHLSPDHGNGTLEAMLVVAILAIPIAFTVVRAALAFRTRLAAYSLGAAGAENRRRIDSGYTVTR
jgi:ABC-type phosphate transport system permease subunit